LKRGKKNIWNLGRNYSREKFCHADLRKKKGERGEGFQKGGLTLMGKISSRGGGWVKIRDAINKGDGNREKRNNNRLTCAHGCAQEVMRETAKSKAGWLIKTEDRLRQRLRGDRENYSSVREERKRASKKYHKSKKAGMLRGRAKLEWRKNKRAF